MSQRMQNLFEGVGMFGLWVALAALMTRVAFQMHATLIFLGLKAVQLPAMHEVGWNTHTIHGLGRFLTLILGIVWLFFVTMLQESLRDAIREKRLKALVVRSAVILGGIYLVCVAILFIAS
jgi:hypothetical protein